MENERPLEGQVSLVTGAGRGIGRAVALGLVDAGSAVVLGARTVSQLQDVAAEVRARGGRALVTQLDVTDPESVQRFVAGAADAFGRIDVLVNNAGSNNAGADGAVGPLWEINADAWWHDVEVNLRGAFLCTHQVLAHMVARGSGRIVNIASMAAASPWPYDSAYACAKAAVVRLTDSVAAEVRDHGVAVFALSPGSVDTELRAAVVESAAGRTWMPSVSPSPQWVPADLVANVVVLLASGQADGLTGRLLRATTDLPELVGRAADIAARDVLQLRLVPE